MIDVISRNVNVKDYSMPFLANVYSSCCIQRVDEQIFNSEHRTTLLRDPRIVVPHTRLSTAFTLSHRGVDVDARLETSTMAYYAYRNCMVYEVNQDDYVDDIINDEDFLYNEMEIMDMQASRAEGIYCEYSNPNQFRSFNIGSSNKAARYTYIQRGG